MIYCVRFVCWLHIAYTGIYQIHAPGKRTDYFINIKISYTITVPSSESLTGWCLNYRIKNIKLISTTWRWRIRHPLSQCKLCINFLEWVKRIWLQPPLILVNWKGFNYLLAWYSDKSVHKMWGSNVLIIWTHK